MRYALKSVVKKALATKIIDLLAVSHFDTTQPVYDVFHPLSTVNSLIESYDVRDLVKLHEVTALLQGTQHVADRLTLSHVAAEKRLTVIRALHLHQEWVVKNPLLFTSFQHFVNVLDKAFKVPDSELKILVWFAEVLANAYSRITEAGYPEESHLHNTAMLSNVDYVSLLLKNVGYIDELMDYRYERGMDRTSVMEPHDEDDFAEYLAQRSVRDGWL